MGAAVIIDLAIAGAKKLFDLIPIWIAAPAEERAKIEARARALVDGLDAKDAAADARDDAATQAARDAIKNAGQK